MKEYTIEELKQMRESEDHVEFKEAKDGNFPFGGGDRKTPKDRRRCILGYVTALSNEKGGRLVFGMRDKHPHDVCGTSQAKDGLGDLESKIFRCTSLRTHIYERFQEKDGKTKRVVIIEVPSRPIGKVMYFEDIPLMRVGDELLRMDDTTLFNILQEQEPDFSEIPCKEATMADLDTEAIATLKDKYAKKQNNTRFVTLSDKQALRDLNLIQHDQITNAAVLLVGKKETLERIFPQAKVMLEFRNSETQITYSKRLPFSGAFYKLIDELWEAINDRNGETALQEGAYIGLKSIPFFNEEVIRELVNNAFAHRDYRSESEIIIKISPSSIEVTNAGGFPRGVTADNLLTAPSTPRNRLLADVMSKTGIVERSGQGIDKIFYYTLSEGKPMPDYSRSDNFFVTAKLSSIANEPKFALFLQTMQQEQEHHDDLSVFDVITLCKIRDGEQAGLDKQIVTNLYNKGYIEKHGRTKGTFYTLHRMYYDISGKTAEYSKQTDWNAEQMMAVILPHLQKYGKAKKNDLLKIVGDHVSDKQFRNFLSELAEKGILKKEGTTRNLTYSLSDTYIENNALLDKVFALGLEEIKKQVEANKKKSK